MLDSGGKQTLTPPVPPSPRPTTSCLPSPRAKTSHITAQNVHAGEKVARKVKKQDISR